MIVRILLAVWLALLVAAPGAALAGSVQIELVEESAPHADDEAVAPRALAPRAAHPRAARPPSSEDIAPLVRPPGGIFRPPRPSLA